MLDGSAIPQAPEFTSFFADKKGRPVALPPAAGPVADSHTHLHSLHALDPALALARAAVAGVRFVIDVVDPADDARDPETLLADLARWQRECAEILDAWHGRGVVDALGERPVQPRLRLVAGCHPHNASRFDDDARRALRTLLADPLCAGIGEIGLDYHYDLSPRQVQREVFREQLALACELDAPLSLHIREAHHEAVPILAEVGVPAAGAVLHCFDLGPDDARPFQELGCVLGIGGAVTFKRNDATREAVAAAPLGGVLTETDAPYMAPEPLRGVPCEPAMAALTAHFASNLTAAREGDPAKFYTAAFEHAMQLFDGQVGLPYCN